MTPNIEQDLEASLADLDTTRQQETSQTWVQQAEKSLGTTIGGLTASNQNGEPGGIAMWIAKLPRNISVGLIDAAVNTADAVKSIVAEAPPIWEPASKTVMDADAKKAAAAKGEAPAPEPEHPVYTAAKQGVMNFRDYLAQGSETSDEVTQAISQYAIPFIGYSKLIGGLHSTTMLGTALKAGTAEALTAATVLKPHDPRAADMLQLGKHVEGKFGDAMNTIAPDGSLLNHYINYMTDRENESDAEGRFKNVVDNLALSAAAAGLIKTTAMTLKGGFATAKYALENAGTGPRGLEAQKGHITFHGTPHEFDAFDSSKIGTGEGNQSFGHGLYFAESKGVARSYQKALTGPLGETTADWVVQESKVKTPQEAVNWIDNYIKDVDAGNQAFSLSDIDRKELAAAREDFLKGIMPARNDGNLMEVHIPDEQVNKMLLWDKPLSEQPEVLKRLGVDSSAIAPFARTAYGDVTGQQLYTAMARGETQMGVTSKEAASRKLNDLGIPGIKYLDQGSRGKGEGSHNIVLFDAKHATILKKNDKLVIPERRQEINKQMRAKAELAPAKGAAVVQTGKDHWTVFLDRKPQGSYETEARANEELDALKAPEKK